MLNDKRIGVLRELAKDRNHRTGPGFVSAFVKGGATATSHGLLWAMVEGGLLELRITDQGVRELAEIAVAPPAKPRSW